MNLKKIHIGKLIRQKAEELKIPIARIGNFLGCEEEEIYKMYEKSSIDTHTLLRWSKLLEYDFFRIYTQHLILFAPQGNTNHKKTGEHEKSSLPAFRKNIYTKEVIDFILKLIATEEKTKKQIVTEYRIPKTTLYKWIHKYKI